MSQLTRWTRTVGAEDGIALVVAMGVLLVLGIIATGVLALSVNVNSQTSHDRNSARALAAAESGLRLGTYYLNQAMPIADTECPGAVTPSSRTTASGSPLSCPSATTPYTVTNPDGTTTSFYISGGANTAPLKCAGAAQPDISARPGLTYHQRCITATGTAGNAVRRVQARVIAVSYIFPIPGVVGLDHIGLGTGGSSGTGLTVSQCNLDVSTVLSGGGLTGTMLVEGSLGSNGPVTTNLDCWGGSLDDPLGTNSARLYLGKSSPTTNNPLIYRAQPGAVVRMNADLQLPPLDSIYQTGENNKDSSISTTDQSTTGNDNLTGMSFTLCTSPYDSATRILTLSNNCIVTLQGSTDIDHPKIYNFCQVNYPANGGSIQLPTLLTGGYARLLIDSPNRTGSGCGQSTGGLNIKNGGTLLSNATASLGAQIFVYGVTSSNGVPVAPGTGVNSIAWQNSGNVKTLLIAPKASISFQNNAVITGGLAAWSIDVQNNLVYIWDQNVDRVQRNALFYRAAYADCSRQPTVAGDPSSGC